VDNPEKLVDNRCSSVDTSPRSVDIGCANVERQYHHI
jgi:hypothetical protein